MHLTGHFGALIAPLPTGRLSQGTKNVTLQWYEEVVDCEDGDEEDEEFHLEGLIPVESIQVVLSIDYCTAVRRLLIDPRSIVMLCFGPCLWPTTICPVQPAPRGATQRVSSRQKRPIFAAN